MRIAVLDIGGTAIKGGVWNGQTFESFREGESRAKEGGKALMERAIHWLQQYTPFDAIGISTAGEVDTLNGSIYYANQNIPDYTGMEIRKILEEEFHVPVAVENDVNAAALGELYAGAAQNCSDFLCLTYGTGVGGAIVIEKNIYSGSSYSAGSFGGIILKPELQTEEDPLAGCYERLASTTGLVHRCMKLDASLLNGRKIFEAFHRPEVKEQIDFWIDDISIGLASLISIFNPSTILLGGGIMEQPYIISRVNEQVKKRISPGLRNVEIMTAKLGNMAGLYGAAYLAQKRMEFPVTI